MPLNLRFLFCTCLLAVLALTPLKGDAAKRIYTLAEAAAIDRENAMWQMVDAAQEADPNIARLLAAGFPAPEVAEFKVRLMAMWDIEPSEQFGWLDDQTVEKIKALEQDFTIRMREARLRAETGLKRGSKAPETPIQVRTRWRRAIIKRLDYREIQEFILMNSVSARALNKLTKDIPMKVDERRTLCEMQRDLDRIWRRKCFDRWQNSERVEAVLDQWQRMRELLGDERFSSYLRAADPGFGRMAAILQPIPGVNWSMALDLWWIRKEDEKAEIQMIWGSERSRLKSGFAKAAMAVLGEQAFEIYERDEDARWLARKSPYQIDQGDRLATKTGD